MTIAFIKKTEKTDPIKKIAELAGRNDGSVVVYTNTTKKAREAAEALIELGVDCAYYYFCSCCLDGWDVGWRDG